MAKKLNGTVIVTYRCNAKCTMCNRYKVPSKPEEELSVEEFVGKVKNAFGVDVVRCSVPLEGKINRVAVCGGSGKSFIAEARQKGAQVYVTGDITYHDFYAEKGFMVMDIGHYFSEYSIVDVFANIVSKNFPNFAVSISKRNNNPIYYY